MPTAVLIVCHPGHELRVHGWLCDARPVVCVLTDGSGGGRPPRTDSSRRVVAEAAATVGPVFGAVPDAELYFRLLDRDWPFFTRLADQMAVLLRDPAVELVVGDAAEGYNSGHDVCRLLIDAVVARSARPVRNLAFAVVDGTLSAEPHLRLSLPPDALARKLTAARGYVGMADEVAVAVARLGERAFAEETFHPVEPFRLPDGPPRYEAFGRERVNDGRYATVIRREHLERLADALREYAAGEPPCDR